MMRKSSYGDNLSGFFRESFTGAQGLMFQDRNGTLLEPDEINQLSAWEIDELELHVFRT